MSPGIKLLVGLIVIIFFAVSIVASNGMGEPLKEYSSVIRSSTLALVINAVSYTHLTLPTKA